MSWNDTTGGPAGCRIHVESGLLLIKDATLAQVNRSRSIFLCTADGSRFQWYAGLAYVDFVKRVTALYGSFTFENAIRHVRNANVSWKMAYNSLVWAQGLKYMNAGAFASILNDTTPISVYTFKHGMYSGVGSDIVMGEVQANNESDTTPWYLIENAMLAVPRVRQTGVSTNVGSNTAHAAVPTNLTIGQAAKAIAETQTHWKVDARDYIRGEVLKFLATKGILEGNVLFDVVAAGWSSDLILRTIPNTLLLPWGARPTANGESVLTAQGRVMPNVYGGRFDPDGKGFVHLPYMIGNESMWDAGDGSKSFNWKPVDTANTTNPGTRIAFMGRTGLGLEGVFVAPSRRLTAGFNVAQLPPSKPFGGQPYRIMYDPDGNVTPVTGEDIFTSREISSRMCLSPLKDTTETEATLSAKVLTGGVVDETKVGTEITKFTDARDGATNFDTMGFTPRKLRRMITDCTKVSTTKVTLDLARCEAIWRDS